MIKFINLFVLSVILTTGLAQIRTITPEEAHKIILKASDFFVSNEQFSVKINYRTFAGHDSQVPVDIQSGFIKRYKNSYQINLMNIHTVQNEKIRVSIDSVDHVIGISEPDSLQMFVSAIDVNLKLLRNCKEITETKTAAGATYKLVLPNSMPYSKLELLLDKSGRYNKVKIYMTAKIPIDPDDENAPKKQPRIDLTFSDYAVNYRFSQADFDPFTFIRFKGREIIPASAYQSFEIKDSRYYQ